MTIAATALPLRRGSRGEAVRELQRMLGVAVDGRFGPATKAAVEAFQASHGLTADGLVNAPTLRALQAAPVPPAAATAPSASGAFTVKNHLLLRGGVAVPFKATPNKGGRMTPDELVMHYTGSSSYASAVSWLTNPAAKASAHLVIGAAGEITQLAPFNVVTWHAGQSSFNGRSNYNAFSIGIELVNAGLLARTGAGGFIERLGGKSVPAGKVILAAHKNGGGEQPWAAYDPCQLAVAIAVAQALHAAYRFRDIVGHDDIAPLRKSDPGPAFPMSSFESRVRGRAS